MYYDATEIMKVEYKTFDNTYLNASYIWLTDPEINNLLGAGVISKDGQKKWFQSLDNRMDYMIWGVEYNNKPIGAVGIKNIESNKGEYFGYIGEKAFWGKGIGHDMVSFIMKQAKKRSLYELYLQVKSCNLRAIRLYEKMGFKRILDNNNKLSCYNDMLLYHLILCDKNA